jgi:hypothetical protein
MLRREIIQKSGYQHSDEAIKILEQAFNTVSQAVKFYEELSRNKRVSLPGVSGHFFLRDNVVHYMPFGDKRIDSLYRE